MGLCENLKNARKRIGQTQCSVAKNIGISNTALSNYETGYRQPDLDTLKQLAKYYHISIDELVGASNGLSSVIDLWATTKEAKVAFHGEVYVMDESRSRALRRHLQDFFHRLEEEKIK